MSSISVNRDGYTRSLLLRALSDSGVKRDTLEPLSQLELIDCVVEKCVAKPGQLTVFLIALLIAANSDKESLTQRLLRSEENQRELQARLTSTEGILRDSERDRAVLDYRLKLAHEHPGLEALRLFLVEAKCEPLLEDLVKAGIDSIEMLRATALKKHGFKKAGFDADIATFFRVHLKNV